jgi:uncharacterized surface protein with fasciclin (FAS1) repeats
MKNQIIQFGTRFSTFSIAILLSTLLILSSCTEKEEFQPVENTSENLNDIPTVLDNFTVGDIEFNDDVTDEKLLFKRDVPTFKTLVAALIKTNLLSTVAKNRLTVFAPTDKAFEALGLNARNIGSVPNLKQILLYHVIGTPVFSNQLSEGFVPTLNGAAVQIGLSGGVMVNDAKVIIANIRALNGVIHAIDKVLLPPTKNLVEEALSYDPEFSILVAAVKKAGLADVLATGGTYTVFAPTNAAFVNLLGELGATSLDDIDVATLTKVLLYHVVDGRVFSSDLKTGPVQSLNGTFSVDLSTLQLTDFYNRKANLVPSLLNIQATNGVIHVIDRVILPQL